MKNLAIVTLFFAVLVLNGCAMLSNGSASRLAVQYATLKVAGKAENQSEQVARASRILEIAKEGKAFFDNRSLPIVQIETVMRARIDVSSLNIADALLVDALIAQIVFEINSRASVDEGIYVTGSQVLGWVIDAARLAGAR